MNTNNSLSGREKEHDKDLREKLAFYKTFVDNTQDWELFVNQKGKLLYSTPSFEHFTGLSNSNLMSGKISLTDFIHPEDAPRVRELFHQAVNRQLFTAQSFRIISAKKKAMTVEARIKTVYKDHEYLGLRISVRDISDYIGIQETLKRSEITLKAILNTSKVGIGILDRHRKYTFVNREWCQLLGYQNEELLGANYNDVTHPEDRAVSEAKIEELLTGNIDSYRIEKRFIRKDGSYFWGDLSVSAIYKNGKLLHIVGIISDITERKDTLESLKQFSSAVEQSPAAILITGTDGTITYVNPQFCSITGYCEGEALGQNPRILNSGYHDNQFYQEMWSTLASGRAWKGELYNRHKDGSLFWEEAVISPIMNAQNQIINYIAIKQDITEKKHIQQQLNNSQKNLQQAQAIANVGHWEYNIVQDQLFWSDQTFRIFGVEPSTFTPTFNKMARLIHPEDARRVKYLYFKSLHKHTKLKTTFRIVTPEGKTRHVVQRVTSRFSKEGKPLSSLGVVHDITDQKNTELALKRNEALFRSIFNTSPAGITIFNEEGTVLLTNRSSQKIHGYTHKEKIGNPFYLAIHPESREELKKKIAQAFKGNRTFFNEEIKFRHKEGHVVWVKSVGSLLPSLIDGKKAIVTVNQDISKTKANKQKLIELNATKDKFFSIIAHDLKNPFNSILGISELLLKQLDTMEPKDIKELAEAIYNSGQNAYSLLENLLQWSNSQTGRIAFHPEMLILNDVVREVGNLIKGTATQKEISIKCEIPKNIPIQADRNMLHTILRNLITNATKFTQRGGTITITAKRPNGYTQISISDNGIGMNQVTRNNLFSIDRKNTETGTENEKGSGLGLILCKEFVEKHKGKIWAESTPGKGSTFYFTIADKHTP
ncbi:MAG: PAS domain S-box protein [Bacteroidota bacterium]